MADEKKTPAPEEPVSGKSPDAGKHDPNAPAQEETGTPERPESSPVAETPKPPEEKVPEDKSQTGVSNKDGAEVVVPIEKISELIAKRNQAAREKAEQNTPPDKAPEGKQMGLFETAPTPKHGGRPPKAAKEPKDKPPQEKKPRDKVSQGKRGKNTPDKPAPGGGGVGGAPSVQNNAPTPDVAGSTAAPPRPVEDQKVVYLKLSELHPFHTFRPHPFQVKDDAKMKETVASVKQMGVITPATVRPEKDGSGYEIIAGHRRCRASELAGLEVLPCIVREMTDHEAIREMRDSNKQRDGMLPTELARLLDLEMEDIKHQGVPLKNVAEGDIGKRSAEIVGEAHGMNYKKVMRYIRLNSLVPELQAMVDGHEDENGKRIKGLGFMPAVELSYIRPKNQQLIAVSIEGEQASPSVAQAKKLRELDQQNKLTGDVIDAILSEEKKEVGQVIISTDELSKYFGKEVTPRQMKDQIMALLDEWKEKQPTEKKAELEK